MTFAALGHALDLQGVLTRSALVNGAGKQQCARQCQNSKDEGFYIRIHHDFS